MTDSRPPRTPPTRTASAAATLDRRGFARRLLAGVAALFGALFGLPGAAAMVDPALRGATGRWTAAGALADLREGAARRFTYEIESGWEKRRLVGFLVKRGEVVDAFSARCTHAGCTVRFRDGRFRCPCHGGEYTLAGAPAKAPVTAPLHKLETRVEGGTVKVRV